MHRLVFLLFDWRRCSPGPRPAVSGGARIRNCCPRHNGAFSAFSSSSSSCRLFWQPCWPARRPPAWWIALPFDSSPVAAPATALACASAAAALRRQQGSDLQTSQSRTHAPGPRSGAPSRRRPQRQRVRSQRRAEFLLSGPASSPASAPAGPVLKAVAHQQLLIFRDGRSSRAGSAPPNGTSAQLQPSAHVWRYISSSVYPALAGWRRWRDARASLRDLPSAR